MKVLLFAGLAEAAGQPAVETDTVGAIRVSELKEIIAKTYPGTADMLSSCFAAINQVYADDDAYVQEGDEVAFIPPVSGG